jgi:hypothetical protein
MKQERADRMPYQFNRWIITLGAQVRSLYENMHDKDPEIVKKEAEASETELQQLYVYAKQHQINLIKYYHSFVDIEKYLLLINEYLHCKQENQ